jgi:hypothetical protein
MTTLKVDADEGLGHSSLTRRSALLPMDILPTQLRTSIPQTGFYIIT